MTEKIYKLIEEKWFSMNQEAQSVLYVICDFSKRGLWITQDQLSHQVPRLGHHETHEEPIGRKKQSTLRKVRQIVRDIRIEYGIPVISGRLGYKIPDTQQEAEAYLVDLEREAKAQAAAWYRTYKAMSDALSLQSSFFESQKEHYENPN